MIINSKVLTAITGAAVLAAGTLCGGGLCAGTAYAQAQEPAEETQAADSQAAEQEAAQTEVTAEAGTDAQTETELQTGQEALYLGVENYGAPETCAENKETFRYRFSVAGEERVFSVENGERNEEGEPDYPIQNLLKEGYSYLVTTDGDTVTAVQEIPQEDPGFEPAVSGTPGERTLSNFLRTALMPAGTTLYIYGGGWDWQDAGSSVQSRTLGVSADWVRFFRQQDADFTYKEKDGLEQNADPAHSYYPYGAYNEYYYAGLDCSGYLGWVLYNTFETENGREGYVGSASGFSRKMSEYGWGEWSHTVQIPDGTMETAMKPGDIMSMNGHVWISLGTCSDGSIVILHSTPSFSRTGQPGGGVQIGAIGNDESCEAYVLADRYMSQLCPEWYERYPVSLKDPQTYFTFDKENAGQFSWDTTAGSNGVSDPDGLQQMAPEEVLQVLTGI